MLSYADTEYEGGLYKEYVEAREMKLDHFRYRMRLLAPRVSKGQLLDVGCSCGYLMEVAAEAGFDVHGLEFSKAAIAAAAPSIQPRIRRSSIEGLEGEQQFNLITAFDLIEHIERPGEFLSNARQLLLQGGTLAIATPDAGHFLRHVMGSSWPMLQPMQHLTIFSREGMRIALEEAGFKDIAFQDATKTLTYEYLTNQLRTLTPSLFSVMRTIGKAIPDSVMRKYRHVNIGEFMAIATRTDGTPS